MKMNQRPIITKKIVATLVLVILALVIFMWLYSHGRVELVFSNGTASPVDIELIEQSSGKSTMARAASGHLSKVMPSGTYQIISSQVNKESFTIVKLGRFLSKTSVGVSLETQKARSFIGDGPDACTFYTDRLFSFECGESASSLSEHVPASSFLPTYKKKYFNALDGILEGFTKTADGKIELIHPIDLESSAQPHFAVVVDDNLKPIKSYPLDDLNPANVFNIIRYSSGFIVYDNSYKQILYYPNVSAKPVNLVAKGLKNSDLKPISIKVSATTVTITYSNTEPLTGDSPEIATDRIRNEIVVLTGNESKSFSLNKIRIKSAASCDNYYLCILDGADMLIYRQDDLSKTVGKIDGASEQLSMGNKMLVFSNNRLISLDIPQLKGQAQYSLGSYKLCGLNKLDESRLVVCASGAGKKRALLVNTNLPDIDTIDQKIYKLSQMPEISGVSAYGNYIFISPDYGQPEYDSSTGTYAPKPAVQSGVDSKIANEVAKLGIDQKKYKIINTEG